MSIRDGKHRALLALRHDRLLVAGSLTRPHQEDFCQALGYSHEQKYQAEGGPGLKECLALLEDRSREPLLDKGHLIRVVVYNFLIGNCDAHAKNVSLLIAKEGARLAPFYDLMSTVVYQGLPKISAMKIGGEARPDWVMQRHWERLARDANVAPKAITDACKELSSALPAAANKLAETFIAHYGAKDTIQTIAAYSTSMSKKLIEGLARQGPGAAS